MNWKIVKAVSLSILFYSCEHEPNTYIKPVPPVVACDTLNMSYKKDIHPMLKVCCYECHSDSVTQNGNLGTDLENFTQLKQYLSHDYRGDGVYGSNFIHCLEHAKLVPDMPPTYALDSCSLGQIRSWIRDGANNN